MKPLFQAFPVYILLTACATAPGDGSEGVIIPAGGGVFYSQEFLDFLGRQMSVVYEDASTLVYRWNR